MRLGADRRGAPQDLELGRLLAQPHLVQHAARVHDLGRRHVALARAQPHRLQDLDDACVELRVAAEHVEQALRALEQAGQLRVEGVGRVRLVRAVVGDRTLDARPVARPGFSGAVPRLDEERVGGAAVGAEHGHRVRMVEAGQVVEVAVLPERELRVGRARDDARALHDGHGPGAHALDESLATRGKHEGAG